MLDDADALPPSKELVRPPSFAASLVDAVSLKVMLAISFISPAIESDGE